MTSTNGHGPKRAILYARVSTDEQARSAYSLAQQIEALRGYTASEGYEVLEEVADPGQSGASLERPGMDRGRDLVASGGVSVVLAQDRDRFAREPAYHYLLRREFEEYGTKLRALNDRGDGSPEGELTDGILDQLAKFERAKTAERTRRGRLRKAKQGKIVGTSPRATYGFRYNATRDGYCVEESMCVVRRIFRMIGEECLTLRTVARTLERDGVPPPNGGRWWNTQTIRDIILDDCYKPHTFEEIEQLVNLEVATQLDTDKYYGVSWYNRRRVMKRQVPEDGPEGRSYRKVQKSSEKPRSEWTAVPVPVSGVPRSLVDLARDRIKDNISPKKVASKFWELSGGIIYCGSCGRRLDNQRTRKSVGDDYHHYYRCRTRHRYGPESCSLRGMRRADEIETQVWEAVSGLMKDPEQLRSDLQKVIEQERRDIRGEPLRQTKVWLDKLAEVDRKRSGFQDMAAEGLISLDELRIKLVGLEETRKIAQRELELLASRQERLKALEQDKEAILESYARMAPEALDGLTPEERHQFYRMLRLRVIVEPDGATQISGAFNEAQAMWPSETTSGGNHA